MFSMSETYWRKVLSVDMRSWTVVQAWRTVAWSFPPSSEPIVEREQLGMMMLTVCFLLHKFSKKLPHILNERGPKI